MFWVHALMLAQVMECGLEPELKLAPIGDYKPLTLKKSPAAKGMEAWSGSLRGTSVLLTRRIADGALGLSTAEGVVPLRSMGLLGFEGEVRIPLGEKGFKRAPVAFRVFRAAIGYGSIEVTIQAAANFYIAARCDGKLALLPWDGKGPQGLDTNGDGKIDVNSPAEYARIQGGVFSIAGQGFTIQGVDWEKRRLLLQPRELGPTFLEEETIPDFAYVDRLNETRRLSSHGDSYTLLDFWAAWCGPCIAAFPQLKLIGESHRLKILGFNGDEDPATASRTLAQLQVLWPDVQSTNPPWLMDYRLRVGLYPTYILLDPQRKIILRTESTLELLEAVRRLVPKRNFN